MLEWLPSSKGKLNGECRRLLGPQKCIDGVAVGFDRPHSERLVLQCFQCGYYLTLFSSLFHFIHAWILKGQLNM